MNNIFNSARTSSLSLMGVLTKSLVLLGLMYLILISSYVEGLLNPILLTVLLVIYLFTKSEGDLGIEIPSLVFILVLILTSIPSIDPRRSFYEVWLIGIGIFLIFVTARIVQLGFSSRTLVHFLLLIGLGFMIFSWLDASRWYLTWLSHSPGEWIPGISFRLNGGNTIAAYYHGILMIGIACFVYSRSRIERFFLGAYCLSAALLIFLSSSRGSYLSVLGGLTILVFLKWRIFKGWTLEILKFYRRQRLIFLALSLMALIIFTGLAFWYVRNMQSHPTHVAAMQSRNAYWGPAWEAFLRSPWIGNGPYTFASEYMNSQSVPPSSIYLHAHSTYLDILSGSGLVGFLVSSWLMGTLLYLLWRQLRHGNAKNPQVILGALLALTSFLIHSIFDGLYLMPFAALNLCILIGSALGERERTHRKLSIIPLGLGIGVAAVAWVNLWLTTPYQNGIEAASRGELEHAAEQFNLSTHRDPGLVLTHQQLGLAEAMLASEGDQAALDRAIPAMEETVRLDPTYSPNHANLGALYRERRNLEQAVESFICAVELAPEWALWHLNLGEVYEMQEKWELSAQSYHEALSLEPSWVADGFWIETSFRSDVLADWQTLSLDVHEDEIQLSEEEVIAQSIAVPILELATQKISEMDFSAAERLLGIAEFAHFRRYTERLELIWLKAEIAASKEDWSSAISLGEEALNGFRLQGAYGPGGAGKTLYGTGIFRQNMMDIDIVPQLTLIHLPDPWPQRMVKLGSWYLEVGEANACTAMMDELLQKIPDFWQRFPDLELDCSVMR